jgi:hypothetical protein
MSDRLRAHAGNDVTAPKRLRPKRGDLVRVLSGPHAGRVGLVASIDCSQPKRYVVRGHDDRTIGTFVREQLQIVQHRMPRQRWAARPNPALDVMDALLGIETRVRTDMARDEEVCAPSGTGGGITLLVDVSDEVPSGSVH